MNGHVDIDCSACGNCVTNSKHVLSHIQEVPLGLDRDKLVRATIWKCQTCGSFTCGQYSSFEPSYEDSICFEASLATTLISRSFYPFSSNLIPKSIVHLLSEQIIVDFGCGAGFLTEQLQSVTKKVIGVDLDPCAVKVLNSKNIEAIEGDASVLSRINFDSIAMMGVIEHFSKPIEIIDLAASRINKNGIFLIYYPNINSLSKWLTSFGGEEWDMFLEPGHHSFLSRKFLISAMKNYGFQLDAFWTTSNYSRGKNPFATKRIPKSERLMRSLIDRSFVFRFGYLGIYKFLDLLHIGDISCYAFRKIT